MIAAKRETLAAKDRVKPVFIIILPSLIDCDIAQRACVAKIRRDTPVENAGFGDVRPAFKFQQSANSRFGLCKYSQVMRR